MIEIKDDFYEVENYLMNCERVVVWGTGKAFRNTNEYFNCALYPKVEYFIETTPKQKQFLSKPIMSIQEGLNDKEKLEILVCSSYIDEIVQSLRENYNDKHIIIYPATSVIYNIAPRRHLKAFDTFLDQGISIQNEILNKDEWIGIYIHNWKSWIAPYYCLALGILLKAKGMNVRFIYDDIEDKHALYYEEYLRNTGYLLNKIKEKWDIPFDQLSSVRKEILNGGQKSSIENIVEFSLVSYTRRLIHEDKEKNQDNLNIIRSNCSELAEILNHYLDLYKFKTVFALTNLHYALGVVEEICKSKQIHTTSAELMRGGYSYSVNGPAIRQNDIPQIVNLLREEEKRELIRIADKHICSVGVETDDAPFDFDYVLIPLNIYWDSAAYANEDIFNNDYLKWLGETIEFILENTEHIKVVVRQHPHEKIHGTGQDLIQFLREKFGGNQRFVLIDYNNDISTYRLIMHSKVILPNTSTIGLEAICLNRPVITKSKVYYADQEICTVSKTRDEYFLKIKRDVEKIGIEPAINFEKAKLYLALSLLNRVKTNFTHHYFNMTSWISNESLDSLYQECCENGVFSVFEEKAPILITQIRSKLLGDKIKLHFTDEDI
ncbi:hypothetical protein [Paenibacillus massiliensis]|uniref:capsular polysaccharide export protein, LipB/KpsS family n=1 Tax=Paenibacillus massiliensis TaxID=225917 RepID=UPI0004713E99|nr:hypothetical protein [Paenibacillus massiliensis]